MRNIWTIAWKEFKLYFSTPIFYIISAMVFLFLGIIFYSNLAQVISASASSSSSGSTTPLPGPVMLGPLLTILLFATPAITMRLLAEENSLGTIELMLTAPVRDSELVIGKWLGGTLFTSVLVGLTWIYPIFLHVITKPSGIDQGPLVSSYLVILLLMASLVAIGVCISAPFKNVTAAFFASLMVSLMLWVSSLAASALSYSGGTGGTSLLGTVLQYADFTSHFYNTAYAGRLDLRDIVYYVSIIVLMLFFATRIVESRRWR
jgi:ABC-2 type transport system permease protein